MYLRLVNGFARSLSTAARLLLRLRPNILPNDNMHTVVTVFHPLQWINRFTALRDNLVKD